MKLKTQFHLITVIFLSFLKCFTVLFAIFYLTQYFYDFNFKLSHIFTISQRSTSLPKGWQVDELIRHHGYPLEIHEIITADNYILTLHRIPSVKKSNGTKQFPVLLVHGILNSASEFLTSGPGKSLAYLLSDSGYDVWLANSRGTTWSRRHLHLDPNHDRTYWEFSFHEMGMYDIPACIDHILATTKSPKLHYIGFSQGATVFFVMTSEIPQFTKKIATMSALAPGVFVGNTISPVVQYLSHSKIVRFVYDSIANMELFPNNGYVSNLLKCICQEHSFWMDLCIYQYSVIQGFNDRQVNRKNLATVFHNTPAGISKRQLEHLTQIIRSGLFHQFDYGEALNVFRYGQATPLHYNLSKAIVPVYIYSSQNDWVVQPKDIDILIRALPWVVKKYVVPLKEFTHNDFLHAIDVDILLYRAVINDIVDFKSINASSNV